MTIESLSIQKFKCFTSLKLPLAPLTILTGFNAAGKSTSIQALLLLAQALRVSPRSSIVALNGSLVSLGSAGDIVTRNSDGVMSLGVTSESEAVDWRLAPSRELDGHFMKLASVTASNENKVHQIPGNEWWPNALKGSKLLEALRDVVYLGSARDSSAEAYPSPFEASSPFADVGPNGEFAPSWYVKMADDEVDSARRHPTEERLTVRGQVDAWLNELFPGASVNAETVANTSLSRLEFRIGRGSGWHRPSNTGYGLGYAFPVLVALTTMRAGQILIVESPEGHLHPRAQSKMGSILARFAAGGLQIIIESHSDHILSGIRLSVKDKILPPDKAALHFFQGHGAEEGQVTIVTPTVDTNGSIDSWPDGFFDQSERDLAKLAGWL